MDDLEKQKGTSSIQHQALYIISNPSVKSNLSYSPETLNSGRNWWYFVPCDLEIRWMILKNNRAPLLYYIKLCASFQIHRWSQTGITVRKRSIRVKIGTFLSRVTLKFADDLEKQYGTSPIQTGVTVRKGLNWVLTSVTLTFDLCPWPLAWTSLLSMVITPEKFIIRWQEHSKKVWQIDTGRQTEGQTDGQTDGRTERTVLRAAWSQLKCF